MRDINVEEFKELMDNGNKILIFLCGTNCNRCHFLEPELEKVEGQMTIPLYKANLEEDQELANILYTTTIPALRLMEGGTRIKEYNDVNTGDFILDYFGIRIPEHHDHDQEPEEVLDSNE